MNEREIILKNIKEQARLSKKDKWDDIDRLEYILYSIKPYSPYWRWGMVGTLKRAIKLLRMAEGDGKK